MAEDDWTAAEIEIADLLEKLIVKGMWTVRDWSPYQKICNAAGWTSPETVTADAMRMFFDSRLKKVDEPAKLRIGMLLGLSRRLWKKSLDERRLATRKEFNEDAPREDQAVEQRRKRNNRLSKLRLARAILEPGIPVSLKMPFFGRHKERGELLSWIESDVPAVVICGPTSVGKSRLAVDVVEACEDIPSLIVIDASSPDRMIYSMLRYIGHDRDSRYIEREFNESILGKLERDSIVLIDNALDWESIEAIAYWSPRCIITSDRDFVTRATVNIDFPHRVITLRPDFVVAASIVRWYRPGDTGRDIDEFAFLTEGKLGVVVDCLNMFGEDELPLVDMIDMLQHGKDDTASLSWIKYAENDNPRAIHKIYAEFFRRLERQSADIARWLAILVHTGGSNIPVGVVEKTLENLLEANNAAAKSVTLAAIRELTERAMISHQGGMLKMSDLTRNMFLDSLGHYQSDIYRSMVGAHFDDDIANSTTLAVPARHFSRSYTMEERLIEAWAQILTRALRGLSENELMSLQKAKIHAAFVTVGGNTSVNLHAYINLMNYLIRDCPDFVSRYISNEILENWYLLLFHRGELSRGEFLAKTDVLFGGEMDSVLASYRAFAGYRVKVFRDSALVKLLPRKIEEYDSLAEIFDQALSVVTIYYEIVRSISWTGYARRAVDFASRALVMRKSPYFHVLTLVLMWQAVEIASVWDARDVLYSYVDTERDFLLSLAEDDVELARKTLGFSRAIIWFMRSRIDDCGEFALLVRDHFVDMALTQRDREFWRDALHAYVEAVAIDEWMKCSLDYEGIDPVFESRLCRIVDAVDEPHETDRLQVVRIVGASIRTRPGRKDLETLSEIIDKARMRDDARTLRQASVAFLHLGRIIDGVDVSVSTAIEDEVFIIQRNAVGSSSPESILTRGEFAQWLSHLVAGDCRAILLL
ncbi:hypothetical protein [Nocardia salmonicida]|uniref:hypothetical protein n=1 Tax=Nocardia salmonicida TaxID=53431 RepID=UPI00340ECAD2